MSSCFKSCLFVLLLFLLFCCVCSVFLFTCCRRDSQTLLATRPQATSRRTRKVARRARAAESPVESVGHGGAETPIVFFMFLWVSLFQFLKWLKGVVASKVCESLRQHVKRKTLHTQQNNKNNNNTNKQLLKQLDTKRTQRQHKQNQTIKAQSEEQ